MQQQIGEEWESVREKALQAPGSVQKSPAGRGYPMEQISTCSLGGDSCAVDEAWRRHSPQRASVGAAPGSGCSLWRGACGGAGGLGELLPMGSHAGVPPKGCALWYGAVLERCLRICSLWKAWTGSVWEGQHSMRWTPQRGRGRKRPWRSSRLSTAPIPCTAQEREAEEGEWGEGAFSSLLSSVSNRK